MIFEIIAVVFFLLTFYLYIATLRLIHLWHIQKMRGIRVHHRIEMRKIEEECRARIQQALNEEFQRNGPLIFIPESDSTYN